MLFQLQDEQNVLLQSFINKLPNVQWAHTEESVNISITLTSLMPSNTDVFYTYKGSLTTPPCNEAVTWIIFGTPVPISFRQVYATIALLCSVRDMHVWQSYRWTRFGRSPTARKHWATISDTCKISVSARFMSEDWSEMIICDWTLRT